MNPDQVMVEALRRLQPLVPACAAEVAALADRLGEVNAELWALEDEARSTDSDARLASVKRSIDDRNQRRADLVSQIDWALSTAIAAHFADVAPLTCSVGGALDRLTVAALRVRTLLAAGDERAGFALRQLEDLLQAMDADWSDLRAGRRRLPQPGALKRYGAQPEALSETR
jgi:hypothetical protein